jgi:hypothetical protein
MLAVDSMGSEELQAASGLAPATGEVDVDG